MKSLRFLKIFSVSAFAFVSITSCYTPSDYLNTDFIPDHERLYVKTDTSFIMSAHTIEYDTAYIMGFEDIVLGAINNNVFGKTRVSFMSQIRPSFLNHKFGTNPEVDSIFLFLKLNAFYGDKSVPVTINVYELATPFDKDSLYNAFSPVGDMINPTPIGTASYQGESYVKVPISNEWAQKLITADSVTMATDTSFVKYVYGLYVSAEHLNVPGKAMYYFTYMSSLNNLSLYYTKNEPDTTFQVKFDYQFTSYSHRNIRIEHDKTAATPGEAIVGLNDTITQDSVFYLQGLAGTKGLIELTDIAAWADSMPVIINRAELRIPITNAPFFEQDSSQMPISIFKKVSNSLVPIIDMSGNNFGGTYSKSKGYYSFNITNHIQDLLLLPNSDLDIYLEPRTRFSRANQTILSSYINSNRIKLIITYTKL